MSRFEITVLTSALISPEIKRSAQCRIMGTDSRYCTRSHALMHMHSDSRPRSYQQRAGGQAIAKIDAWEHQSGRNPSELCSGNTEDSAESQTRCLQRGEHGDWDALHRDGMRRTRPPVAVAEAVDVCRSAAACARGHMHVDHLSAMLCCDMAKSPAQHRPIHRTMEGACMRNSAATRHERWLPETATKPFVEMLTV